MFSRELNNAKTVKRMVDFLGHHLRIMKKIILILAAMLTLAACTKEGDVIYQTAPADAPSTTPLVTVIYDPNGVGDGNYNDLIYQSVEQAAREHGLRTMQLSPSTREEGLAYLETLFQQMSVAQDTVRRLFIVAAASYDDYLRRNNDRLAANPYTDLLYLETSEPLDGKGSTLCLPYHGAMYEGGAHAQALAPTPTERDFIRRGCRGAAPAESVLWQYSDGGQTRYDSKH